MINARRAALSCRHFRLQNARGDAAILRLMPARRKSKRRFQRISHRISMIEYSLRHHQVSQNALSSNDSVASRLLVQWRHRPLIACAFVAVCGAALGFQSARFFETVPLGFATLVSLWLMSLGFALWTNRFRTRALWLAPISLFLISALYSAARTVAPRDDISQFVTRNAARDVSQKPLSVELRGEIASRPRIGDFGIEFPLRISRATTDRLLDVSENSRVWMRLPLGSTPLGSTPLREGTLREGDTLQTRAELFDLPRAGNWGERELRSRYIGESCWALARVKDSDDWQMIKRADANTLSSRLEKWRAAILRRYEYSFRNLRASYPAANAQLLAALVWGEGGLQQPLPRQTRDRFRAAGMSHVLVASGTQVAFFAGILILLSRVVGSRRWSWILVLPPLLIYALLAGGSDSIWRATVAGICVALALSCGRDVDGLSLWSLALLVLFALDPMQLQNIGFQLSFGATWGLLVLSPVIKRVLEKRFRRGAMTQLAALSLAAQMATTPILLYHFGRVSLVAIGTNFVAVPLAGVLVSFGMLGLVLPLASFNLFLVRSLDGLATLASQVPGAQTDTPPLRLGATIFLYGVLLFALLMTSSTRSDLATIFAVVRDKLLMRWSPRRPRPQSLFALLVLALCVAGAWRFVQSNNRTLRVTLLDVGQGESIVIQSPNGRTVLIDGGTSSDEGRGEVGRAVIVPFLQAMRVKQLDALVLTHADADHSNGLAQVIREVPIALAIDGAALHEQSETSSTRSALPPEYADVLAAWRQKNVPVKAARAGQTLDLGDGVVLTVLWPRAPFDENASDNNSGAVLRLDYGKTSLLFTADIEKEAEAQLLQSGANLKCTVLKAAHHGSKTSTTAAFLKAANPSAAIISSGRYNRYGHPAPQVLNELARENIPTFRTDIDGAIEIACDGETCDVQTFR